MVERRRPYKFGQRRKKALLQQLREGLRRGEACTAIGISRETFRQHLKRDPVFQAAVDQAEIDANERVESALFQAAVSGNVTAIQVWLYNRSPDVWADRRYSRMELTGKDGGPIDAKLLGPLVIVRRGGGDEEKARAPEPNGQPAGD